jgi:hypothetical protein
MKELLTFFEIQVTLMFWGQMGCNYMFFFKKLDPGFIQENVFVGLESSRIVVQFASVV